MCSFSIGARRLAEHLKEVLNRQNLIENNEGKIEFYDSQNSELKKKRFLEILNKK